MFMSPISLASDAILPHGPSMDFWEAPGVGQTASSSLQNRSCNDRNPKRKGLSSFAINFQMILLLLASSHFLSFLSLGMVAFLVVALRK